MILHVTNGDLVAERLSMIGMQGMILPWREILHEGPLAVLEDFSADQISAWNASRAEFIADVGWGTRDDVFFEMNQRDTLLLNNRWHEIVLWFERDLYDQLSIAHFSKLMIGTNSFPDPGVSAIVSQKHLSSLTNDELKQRFERRTPFDLHTATQYALFFDSCSGEAPSPFASPVASMPLIDAAIQMSKLIPGPSGNSTFDNEMLEVIKRAGIITVNALFTQVNTAAGDDAFWSDASFARRISLLAERSTAINLDDDTLHWIG